MILTCLDNFVIKQIRNQSARLFILTRCAEIHGNVKRKLRSFVMTKNMESDPPENIHSPAS